MPRTHVIVDGDSLAKLAGRYLDDPHRSGEIYELNRGVLTDPELLPIGTELVIRPDAVGRHSMVIRPSRLCRARSQFTQQRMAGLCLCDRFRLRPA